MQHSSELGQPIIVLGPKFLKDMEDEIIRIKKNLKEACDRQKHYAYTSRTNREFKVGEHVLLQVNPKKSSLNLGSCTTITTRLCGPIEILDKIWPVSYMFALPTSMNVHNVFHVSLLKKCVHDHNHVIDWNLIQVDPEGEFQV
jgi:hypothetical protein